MVVHAEGSQMQPQLMPVPFYEDTVILVGQENEPYVAMRAVVENMGLAWKPQFLKMTEKFSSTVTEMVTVAEDGKLRGMTCLPLRKLPAWLYSISPNKVKPELRDKIIRYQEECDDALWDYWTKGSASRIGAPNVSQQIALSRHRVALLKELHRTRDNGLRAALHDQLAQTSRQLGLPVPPLETIGRAAPGLGPNEKLVQFWTALDLLDGQGEPYNHSATPGSVLALNFKDLQIRLDKYHCGLVIDRALRSLLSECNSPKVIETNRNVASVLLKKTVRCMVFERRD
ncbi:phage antirepressor N-terminal domain-containing protein [Pseudomonas syringae pv. syringae]|uniref:phage antirepressor N-terminal domain-containing protein n=1 Tax=Pseudomonas syringae TaxID=317 RepID=UPI0023F7878F|nr:phage antirepressor N-terminal domain-containing protein [Pseudomonas syringae]MDF5893481.1 phage antirepressor N-terminal domain-containing protein [Pseudomonas syringae pv. syringae]